MQSARVRRNCCGSLKLGSFWHDITALTSCLMFTGMDQKLQTGDAVRVGRMEIGRREQCADTVERQHHIEFVQLLSRRMRERIRSMLRTAPTVATSRRLQNWRSSSRQQRLRTSVWRQKHSKWTGLRNWMLCLMLFMLKAKQLTWMSCKLSWISATSIFLSRCTMLHCGRNLIPSERRSKMPSQSRLRSPTCRDVWRRNGKRNVQLPICASNSKARRQAWRWWQWTSTSLRKSCRCCSDVPCSPELRQPCVGTCVQPHA